MPAARTLPAPMLTFSPTTTPPSSRQRSPIDTPGPTIAELIRVPSPTWQPSSSTEPSMWAPRAMLTPRPSTVRPPRMAPAARRQPGPTSAGACTVPASAAWAPAASSSRSAPPAAASRRPTSVRHLALEDVERRLQVALGSADVEPVPAGLVAEQALADQGREHVALDRDPGSGGRHLVEHVALEDVGAGVDQVGVDLVRAGLLDELAHRQVGVAPDQPVGRRILDSDQGQGGPRAGLLVLAQLGGQVDVGEDVAVEHEEAVAAAGPRRTSARRRCPAAAAPRRSAAAPPRRRRRPAPPGPRRP